MNAPLDVSATPAWAALLALPRPSGLRDLFVTDPGRTARMTHEAGDLRVDLSKNLVDDDVWAALLEVARSMGVEEHRDAMLRGERINTTEDRAVLHTALRLPVGASLVVDGRDVVPEVHSVLARMRRFAGAVRQGEWRGATGSRISTVVNIGIGGSDLGPAMCALALESRRQGDIALRFVSNVDGADIHEALRGLDHVRRDVARRRCVLVLGSGDRARRDRCRHRRQPARRLGGGERGGSLQDEVASRGRIPGSAHGW